MEWNGIEPPFCVPPFHFIPFQQFPFLSFPSLYPLSIWIPPFLLFLFLYIWRENDKLTKITEVCYFTTSDTNIKKIKSNLIIKFLIFLISKYQSFDIKILFYLIFLISKKTNLFFLIW